MFRYYIFIVVICTGTHKYHTQSRAGQKGKYFSAPAASVPDLILLIITSLEWGGGMEAYWGKGNFPFYAYGWFPEESFVSKYLSSPLGERQTLSHSISHITPMETPTIQNRDPPRAPLYIYYKAKIKTILWKLKIIWNICLSLSQRVTWSSSTNSSRQFHARWSNGWD